MSSSSTSLNVQASWGDQDVELPDVSGNPGGAAAISYAGCTKKNLPEQDVELTPEEKDLYDRYLSSSKFEKDNFHPYNTPPERPCSAFFHLPGHFTTVKDIFDGLLRDGIPASSVRCLQRLPNDGVRVTFSSEEVRNRFLRKSSLIIRKRISVVHPASRRLTYVNMYDAPYELPDSAIEECLKPYGRIYSHRRGKCQGYPVVFNGVCHLRMALEDDIPRQKKGPKQKTPKLSPDTQGTKRAGRPTKWDKKAYHKLVNSAFPGGCFPARYLAPFTKKQS